MSKDKKRIIFFHSPKKYLTSSIILFGVVITFLIFYGFDVFVNYVDGFFVGGAVNIAFGGLSLVADMGAFDMLSYGFARFHGANRDKFSDLYEYSKFKSEQRYNKNCSFGPYIIMGILGVVISIILSLFM